ncbi:MAG: RagB/SusD family nutrient uptake outer membrane protein [Bacteroidota bacterium]
MRSFNKILLGLVAIFSLSCDDFLELENPNDLTAESFWASSADVQLAVNSLYPIVGGLYSTGGDAAEIPIVLGNSRGDDVNFLATQFASYQQYSSFTNEANNSISDLYWGLSYELIFKANSILDNIPSVDFGGDEVLRAQLEAEARFFRGVGYFYLAHLFGQVPIVLSTPESENDFNPAKSETIEEVYDQAIADLSSAQENLPGASSEVGRVIQNTATAFLGKTYLYRAGYLNDDSFYGLAANEFGSLIGEYSLVPNWVDNFTASNENNSESVYEVQYGVFSGVVTDLQGRPGITSVPGIGASFMIPSEFLIAEMIEELTVEGDLDPRFLNTVYASGGLPLFGVEFEDLGDGIFCNDPDSGGDEPVDTEGWFCEHEDWGWRENLPQSIQDQIDTEFGGLPIAYITMVLCERPDPDDPDGEFQERLTATIGLIDGTELRYNDDEEFLGADDSKALPIGDCEANPPVWCVEFEGPLDPGDDQFIIDFVDENYENLDGDPAGIITISDVRLQERPNPTDPDADWQEGFVVFVVLDIAPQDGSTRGVVLIADIDTEVVTEIGGAISVEGAYFRKYLNVNLDCELPGLAENNERVIRYADILLMYAESLLMSGGDIGAAINAVNEVRQRAGLTPGIDHDGIPLSEANLMGEIEHQRIIEFALEGHRIFDLQRWGVVSERLEAAGKTDAASNYSERHKYFPIPMDELINNANIEQNPLWQ